MVVSGEVEDGMDDVVQPVGDLMGVVCGCDVEEAVFEEHFAFGVFRFQDAVGEEEDAFCGC